jgi:dUTP pyrophosphatase
MNVKKLSQFATIPTRGSSGAAGYDLYTPTAFKVEPNTRLLVKLDIAIALPKGTVGRVLPRSGLAVKNGIHIGAGVIDEDYRGNVGVLVMNLGQTVYEAESGDRIAQLVIQPYYALDVHEVDEVDETVRNQGGFGSSGK